MSLLQHEVSLAYLSRDKLVRAIGPEYSYSDPETIGNAVKAFENWDFETHDPYNPVLEDVRLLFRSNAYGKAAVGYLRSTWGCIDDQKPNFETLGLYLPGSLSEFLPGGYATLVLEYDNGHTMRPNPLVLRSYHKSGSEFPLEMNDFAGERFNIANMVDRR